MFRKLLFITLKYGALAAVLSSSFLVVVYYLGRHPLLVSPFLDFRVPLYGIFIFFALREFRDYHQGGVLYFVQGMAGSSLMVMWAALLGGLGVWIFGTLEAGFVSEYIEKTLAYLKSFPEEDILRIGKEVYERNLELLPATNAAQLASLYLVQSLVIGLLLGIIMSVILRKQPKT
ncbi:MAG: DUF4199 domain-containing protein [Cyclobacteriaceae bacterium]|nr:DUF4199 domain-containing protein [Cyclobacteriaceae bacterium]MCX7636392.1 DUF4199 domain-containing protein [Cyclobacteriaceae bacterium]MDW8331633.1 DUF4199 domain-containing protein [Cyclobacteriaceae bacterium]